MKEEVWSNSPSSWPKQSVVQPCQDEAADAFAPSYESTHATFVSSVSARWPAAMTSLSLAAD